MPAAPVPRPPSGGMAQSSTPGSARRQPQLPTTPRRTSASTARSPRAPSGQRSPRQGSATTTGTTVSTISRKSPGFSPAPSESDVGPSALMVPHTSRARSLSKQQLEDTSVTPDDRRAFIASLTQEMNKLVRHPAPVSAGVAASIGTRKALASADGSTSQRKGMPSMKVHLGILANTLSAEDMANLRHCVDHSLVHIDFFAKHETDPGALRQPVFRHVACPESHNIAAATRSQQDTSTARRCLTARTRGRHVGKPKQPAKAAGEAPEKKRALMEFSSDDEYDERPRAPRHLRPSATEPGRLDLNPQPTDDELLDEQMRAENAAESHFKASPRACVDCDFVTRSTRAADERVGLVAAPKRPGVPEKKKTVKSRLAKKMPHLVAAPDAGATRVLPAVLRLRALEAVIGRLSPLAKAMLHGAVQQRDAWQTDDSSAMPSGVALPQSCATVRRCCALHVSNLFPLITDTGSAHDDELHDSSLSEEARNEVRRRAHVREQRQQYSAAAVVANLTVERFMRVVRDCQFDEHAPSFSLPHRSRYASQATTTSAWEDAYAAVDPTLQQAAPHLAFIVALSALTRDADETDDIAAELALWAILTVLRIEGAANADAVARSFTRVHVSLCEAFAIRDLLASVLGSSDGRVMSLSSDIDRALEGGSNVPAAQLISSLRSHFVRA